LPGGWFAASVITEAAPRQEDAFPPRSRVPAITGAASGVQTVAASTFRPRTSSPLALGLGVPGRRTALWVWRDRVRVQAGVRVVRPRPLLWPGAREGKVSQG